MGRFSLSAEALCEGGEPLDGENFEDKKNFLKKIGSNPLLAKRALQFSPKKSWEILLNSWDSATPATLTRASREPNFGLHTNWLAWRDSFRNYNWRAALPVPDLAIKHIKYLLSLL